MTSMCVACLNILDIYLCDGYGNAWLEKGFSLIILISWAYIMLQIFSKNKVPVMDFIARIVIENTRLQNAIYIL